MGAGGGRGGRLCGFLCMHVHSCILTKSNNPRTRRVTLRSTNTAVRGVIACYGIEE